MAGFMTRPRFEVKLWGTRGSLPVSGAQFQAYGGNTICFEVRVGDKRLFFDAGTGFNPAGMELCERGVKDFTLFFSHCHYDHIMGLPFFRPLYDAEARLHIASGHMHGKTTTKALVTEFMQPPYFPIGPEMTLANLTYSDFASGDVMTPKPGVTLRTGMLNHPGQSIGYRIEFDGRAMAIITDTEHRPGTLDRNILDLIDGVDVFLYDATFDDDEMAIFANHGHSTWQQGIRLARAAGVRRVGFVHHALWRTDTQLDEIERHAQVAFPGAFCGRDFQVVSV